MVPPSLEQAVIIDCLIRGLTVSQHYTGVPVVENSVIGAGPFILASVEMKRASLCGSNKC
jgi:hypothetical protein